MVEGWWWVIPKEISARTPALTSSAPARLRVSEACLRRLRIQSVRSMVKAPLSGTPKAKKAMSVASSSGSATQKDSSPALKMNARGGLIVGKAKSTVRIAAETLDAIQNEVLNEIIEHLLERPDKILMTARMVQNESYFKKAATPNTEWLHATIVKFSVVPKGQLIDALLEFRRQVCPEKPWDETLLKKWTARTS